MPRSKVLPRPWQKFGSSFLLHAYRSSASGTTTSGTRASPKPGNSPIRFVSEGSTEWEVIRRPKRRNTIEIQWQIVKNLFLDLFGFLFVVAFFHVCDNTQRQYVWNISKL